MVTMAPTTKEDHPRVCGEHMDEQIMRNMFEGSSPRMRGARIGYGRIVGPAGIIPAYAGSTAWLISRRAGTGDHPRVCGEHSSLWPFLSLQAGSSPRMRGAPFLNLHDRSP